MFTLFTGGHARDCEGSTRRDFLRVGTLGIGGLTLPSLLAAQAAAGRGSDPVKKKSVVVLFLQGGPTHIETFDPKMTAPVEYRAMFGEVKTAVPGLTFGSHFSRLASLADRMAIVRSYRHGISSHAPASEHVIAGGNKFKATMGSLYARAAGTTNPHTGIPRNVVLTPRAAGEQYKDLNSSTDRIGAVGSLSPAYKVFDPSSGSQILTNMKLALPAGRLDDRQSLLGQLDRIRREADAAGRIEGADRFQHQAFDVIVGGVSDAFNLAKEDPSVIARYDTSEYRIPRDLLKKKSNVPAQSPVALGKQMLLARRLVEAGCGFVTVSSTGWDMHGNAFGVNDGMPLLGSAVDKAASAFLEDLERRGMLDDVLLVITGEFGRTPKINNKGGRDHWGNLCALALAGGGLRMGQVVGSSDRTASVPDAEPVSSENLRATIMNTLFNTAELRIADGLPKDVVAEILRGEPIKQLM
ncbi:MAG: DUF1501 domain-containing protein [Planctomycetales bacterium]|nr:DUF1501 domain-containing protein [Planctomycetales bacterium]